MKIKVQSDQVRRNLELFKVMLHRSNLQNNTSVSFPMFVHRKTGEICFDMKSEDKELWDPISFQIFFSSEVRKDLLCQLNIERSREITSEISPESYKILQETIKTIGVMLRLLPRLENLPYLCKELSHIAIEMKSPSHSRDVIYESWHQIDRYEAEKLLSGKSCGTFLFRKDKYTDLLEKELVKAHSQPIKCVTLSYVDFHCNMKEMTLIHIPVGWLIYNDDPNLNEPVYPDVESFLDNMKGFLKEPLEYK